MQAAGSPSAAQTALTTRTCSAGSICSAQPTSSGARHQLVRWLRQASSPAIGSMRDRRPARPSSGIRYSAGPMRCTRPSGSLRTRWRPASSQIAASICAAVTPYRRARTLCRGSRQPGSCDSTARASRSARIRAAGRAGNCSGSAVAPPVPAAGFRAALRPARAGPPSGRAELPPLPLPRSMAAASAKLEAFPPLISGTVRRSGLRTRPCTLSRYRHRRSVRRRHRVRPAPKRNAAAISLTVAVRDLGELCAG